MPILLAVIAGVVSLIGYGFKYLFKLAEKRIESIEHQTYRDDLDNLLTFLDSIVSSAVIQTNQQLGEQLKFSKPDGKLTDEEKEQLYLETENTVLSLIGEEFYGRLSNLLPNVNELITTKIEYWVNLCKKS